MLKNLISRASLATAQIRRPLSEQHHSSIYITPWENEVLLLDVDGQPTILDEGWGIWGNIANCLGLPCWECDIMVGDSLIAFANDVNTEFLLNDDERHYLRGIE
jgi:hypothetical protein